MLATTSHQSYLEELFGSERHVPRPGRVAGAGLKATGERLKLPLGLPLLHKRLQGVLKVSMSSGITWCTVENTTRYV